MRWDENRLHNTARAAPFKAWQHMREPCTNACASLQASARWRRPVKAHLNSRSSLSCHGSNKLLSTTSARCARSFLESWREVGWVGGICSGGIDQVGSTGLHRAVRACVQSSRKRLDQQHPRAPGSAAAPAPPASLDAQVAVVGQQHADLRALWPHLVAQVLWEIRRQHRLARTLQAPQLAAQHAQQAVLPAAAAGRCLRMRARRQERGQVSPPPPRAARAQSWSTALQWRGRPAGGG